VRSNVLLQAPSREPPRAAALVQHQQAEEKAVEEEEKEAAAAPAAAGVGLVAVPFVPMMPSTHHLVRSHVTKEIVDGVDCQEDFDERVQRTNKYAFLTWLVSVPPHLVLSLPSCICAAL